MFNRLAAGGRRTVADVLSVFNKTLNDLKEVERINEVEAARQAQILEEARTAHDAAIQEAALAREVADKLSSLMSRSATMTSLTQLKAECV